MKLSIIHKTNYEFDSDVFFEPQTFRLKPKTSLHCELERFRIEVRPEPVGINQGVDAENNFIYLSWFEGLHKTLRISTESIVKLKKHNPFNFVFYPSECSQFPFVYNNKLLQILAPSLVSEPVSKSLTIYGERILQRCNADTIEFLSTLTRTIHSDFVVESRMQGDPLPVNQTFEQKKGACRDIAWMQIQLLRNMGLASRFVSGYYFIPDAGHAFELHGWLEVYLPGGGWIGLDPSNGVVAAHTHISLACSSFPTETMPVIGVIRGDGNSTLEADISIEIVG